MKAKITYLSILGLAALLPVYAQESTWTGDSGTTSEPESGDWNVSTNWFDDDPPGSANDTILEFLSGSSSYTATNDFTDFNLNRLRFGEGDGSEGITITGNSLTFTGSNPGLEINGPALGTVNLDFSFGSSFNISGNGNQVDVLGEVTGNAGSILTMDGDSTVVFADRINNVDRIVVNNGVFGIRGSEARRLRNTVIEIAGGAVFDTNPDGPRVSRNIEIAGLEGAGTVNFRNHGSDRRALVIDVAAGQEHTFTGSITNLSGGTEIAFIGEGLQVLGDGTSLSSGVAWRGTHVGTGSIGDMDRAAATQANAPGNVRIDGGVTTNNEQFVDWGTLSGTGTLTTGSRDTIVKSNGVLSPGNSIGTLTLSSATLEDGFIYNWEFTDSASDLINVNGTLDVEDAGSSSIINLIGDMNDFDPTSSNILFTFDSIEGALDGQFLDWQVNHDGEASGYFALVSGNDILVAIPEPSTYAAILGLGALGMLLLRRKLRK